MVLDLVVALALCDLLVAAVNVRHANVRLAAPVGYCLAVVLSAAVGVRRMWPWPALGIALAASAVSVIGGFARDPLVALALALYTVAVSSSARAVWRALVLTQTVIVLLAVAVWAFPVGGHEHAVFASRVVTASLVQLLAWLLGRAAANQRSFNQLTAEYHEHRVQEQAALAQATVAQAERAVVQERLRIAQELHDVVAHSMSVIAVQAGAGHHIAAEQPQKAAAALAAIEGAVDHTHDSGEVQFPDGRVETRSLPPGADDAATLVRTADARFVVDQLACLNAGRSPDADGRALPPGFSRALDLARLGMFGHSHGGTTTAETLLLDSRVRAGIDLDGSVSDRVATAGLAQAFLNLNSQIGGPARAKFEHNLPRLWPRLSGWHLWLRLRDSGHLDFTDFALFAAQLQAPPSATAGTLGPIDPHRALAVVSAYLVAFFNETLEHRPQRLLQRPGTAYPEMIFETEPTRQP